MNQFDEARAGFGRGAQRCGEDRDLQILAHVVPKGRHADIGWLERGHPDHLLDTVLNLALVGGGGRTLLQQQLLGHALVHAGIGGNREGVDDAERSSCACCLREYDEEGDDLEVVDALELALHGVSAAGREQAGDGALLLLADDRGDSRGEQVLGRAHVLAVLGRLVEAGAGSGVGQVAADAEPLQAVERLLGLGERQQAPSPSSPTCTT